MPTIYAANESEVRVGKDPPMAGVRSLEYARLHSWESLYAMGSAERIGVTSGASVVQGRLRVLSTSPELDAVAPDASFSMSAHLKHGTAFLDVDFHECYLDGKTLEMSVSGQAEAVYSFTATRVTETPGSSPAGG